ncbi:probable dihydroxyacetone kinase isoform X2 [Polyergus mexicanus]
MSHSAEEQNSQTVHKNSVSDIGPIMQLQSSPGFLVILTFACNALIACVRQLNIMDEECGAGNYGTTLAHTASVIKIAIKEGSISATRPSITFAQISRIIEKEMGGLEGGIYSLFFDTIAKSFCRFQDDEQLTASMWLTVLTSANKMISEVSGGLIDERSMLNPLIAAEHKLKNALNLELSSTDAFGEAVRAAEETSTMQTIHMSKSHSVGSTNCKTFKYPDPGAHAVGIWMRAAYEGFKLKFGCEFSV